VTPRVSSRGIETDRLRLRTWRDDDLEPFAAMNADPEVARFLRDGTPAPRQASEDLLATIRDHWEEHGFGLWAAEMKETGAFIGFVGLAVPTFLPEVLPAVEVGWRVARSYWGRGLATEGGAGSLAYGFDGLGLERIISICRPANVASWRVMEKIGMWPERDTIHPVLGGPLRVYEVTRAAWAREGSGILPRP
jgi:RimJ/RimL family protein N-acetyltransferase